MSENEKEVGGMPDGEKRSSKTISGQFYFRKQANDGRCPEFDLCFVKGHPRRGIRLKIYLRTKWFLFGPQERVVRVTTVLLPPSPPPSPPSAERE